MGEHTVTQNYSLARVRKNHEKCRLQRSFRPWRENTRYNFPQKKTWQWSKSYEKIKAGRSFLQKLKDQRSA